MIFMPRQSQYQRLGLTHKSLKAVVTILTRTQTEQTSVRNSFFNYFNNKRNKVSRKEYNATYHLVMEIIRRKNLLQKYLEYIGVEAAKISHKCEWIALLIVFILKEEEYKDPRINIKGKSLIGLIRSIFYAKVEKNCKRMIEKTVNEIEAVEKEQILQGLPHNKRLALQYYHPYWLTEYFISLMGEDFAIDLMEANNSPRDERTIRLNKYKYNSSDIKKLKCVLEDKGMKLSMDENFDSLLQVEKGIRKLVITDEFKKKEFFIQSKASSSIALILDPQDEDFVVDLAAAPGMKSSHLMNLYSGKLLAFDINVTRSLKLKDTLRSVKSETNHSVLISDSRNLPLKANSVDKVLLDAPCSSTGIFDMYPDHKWYSEDRPKYFAKKQIQLLKEAIRILKPAGIGVYSVCSIHHLEGESVIENFLSDIEILPLQYGIQCYKADLEGNTFSKEIQNCKRTFPNIHDTNAFFICKFKKR